MPRIRNWPATLREAFTRFFSLSEVLYFFPKPPASGRLNSCATSGWALFPSTVAGSDAWSDTHRNRGIAGLVNSEKNFCRGSALSDRFLRLFPPVQVSEQNEMKKRAQVQQVVGGLGDAEVHVWTLSLCFPGRPLS